MRVVDVVYTDRVHCTSKLCNKQSSKNSERSYIAGSDMPWEGEEEERQGENASDRELDTHVTQRSLSAQVLQ